MLSLYNENEMGSGLLELIEKVNTEMERGFERARLIGMWGGM